MINLEFHQSKEYKLKKDGKSMILQITIEDHRSLKKVTATKEFHRS